MPIVTFSERGIFRLVTCWSKNGKYSDHLNELPYENKCSVPPWKILECFGYKFFHIWQKLHALVFIWCNSYFYTGHLLVRKMGNILTTWLNFLMKTNAQCPLENFRMLWLKSYSYLTKAWCQSLLLVKEIFLHWWPVCQKMGNIMTTWMNFLMKTNAQCPLENFRMLWLKILSYLTKAPCFSLVLMQQLFLYCSPVGQENG